MFLRKSCEIGVSHVFTHFLSGKIFRFRFVFSIAVLFVAQYVVAQPTLEQQQIQKRQDDLFRERQREQQLVRPDVRLGTDLHIATDTIPVDEATCFVINEIQLKAVDQGQESSRSARRFQWALQHILYPRQANDNARTATSPLLGKCYGAQGINVIMRRIQNAIIARGYVTTRIVTGPQDLKTGVLVLTVIPGRIHTIKTDRNRHLLPLEEGAILNLRHIEQALENMKSLPSVQTDIQIAPASSPDAKLGDSDLIIVWKQGRPWRATASIDNAGSEATSEEQASLTFTYDDLVNLNDTLTISVGHDLGNATPGPGGSDFYSIRYSFPFKNWSVSASVGENTFFQTIEGSFIDSRYRGESSNASIELSRLIFRDSRRRINAGLQWWSRESKNFVEDTEFNNQRREAEGYKVDLRYREFLGATILNASLSYRKATKMDDQSIALFSDDPNPTPATFNANVSLDVPFALADTPLRYFFQWRLQNNLDPLSSQDYFTIGSRYNVRTGSASSSLSAERGWYIRNDLDITFSPAVITYLGLDYGEVGGRSFQPEWRNLTAGVIGLKGWIKGISYDLSLMSAINAPSGFQDSDNTIQFSLNYQF